MLGKVTREDAPQTRILEVGAGAGNTAFPILASNRNSGLRIHACDFSKKAVELIRANETYDERFITADVWDVAATGPESLPPGLEEGTVDLVLMIFVFSALQPSQWSRALRNIYTLLKPGGEVLFRDYGRGDLAQVRFKKGRYMEENFYVRGDGTRVYFFDRDELMQIWGQWRETDGGDEDVVGGGEKDHEAVKRDGVNEVVEGSNEHNTTVLRSRINDDEAVADGGRRDPAMEDDDCNDVAVQGIERTVEEGGFEVIDVGVDRRLLVNRQRKLKMYRCWLQGRFRKRAPGPEVAGSVDQDCSSPQTLEN